MNNGPKHIFESAKQKGIERKHIASWNDSERYAVIGLLNNGLTTLAEFTQKMPHKELYQILGPFWFIYTISSPIFQTESEQKVPRIIFFSFPVLFQKLNYFIEKGLKVM